MIKIFLRCACAGSSDRRGQSTLEYILILTAVTAGAAALNKQILGALDSGVLFLGATLEQDLKTGRAPLNLWSN